jgi:predicted metal-binding membrane protein
MLTFIGAVVQHMVRIATFRHPGTGLPATRGGALYVLMVMWAVSRMSFAATTPVADGGFDALNAVAYVMAYLGIAVVLMRPPAVAVLMLVDTLTNVAAVGLRFSGVTEDAVYLAVDIWGCAALLVTMSRYVSSAILADKKNRTTGKN